MEVCPDGENAFSSPAVCNADFTPGWSAEFQALKEIPDVCAADVPPPASHFSRGRLDLTHNRDLVEDFVAVPPLPDSLMAH
eukprot:5880657-Karenia_brevis.AAC.1